MYSRDKIILFFAGEELINLPGNFEADDVIAFCLYLMSKMRVPRSF